MEKFSNLVSEQPKKFQGVVKTNVERLRFIDKGNGRNYYTIIDGVVVDVVKIRGNFYRYVYSERLGEFIAKGGPL